MNCPTALLLVICQLLACVACWSDPAATKPGGPVLLLLFTTVFSISWPVKLYHEERRGRRLSR